MPILRPITGSTKINLTHQRQQGLFCLYCGLQTAETNYNRNPHVFTRVMNLNVVKGRRLATSNVTFTAITFDFIVIQEPRYWHFRFVGSHLTFQTQFKLVVYFATFGTSSLKHFTSNRAGLTIGISLASCMVTGQWKLSGKDDGSERVLPQWTLCTMGSASGKV